MRERRALAGAHMIGGDHMNERQAEDVFIEVAGFLRIAAAVGGVMQAQNGRRGGLAGHVSS
jgi:hypothetical protein